MILQILVRQKKKLVAVISRLVEKMLWYKSIKHDHLFQAIKESVKRLVGEEDYELEEAWKYASSKR